MAETTVIEHAVDRRKMMENHQNSSRPHTHEKIPVLMEAGGAADKALAAAFLLVVVMFCGGLSALIWRLTA